MIRRRFLLINGALAVAVAVLVVLGIETVFHKASAANATRTATVTTGTVSTSVSASGNVSPAQTASVNFATGGTIASLDVAVGSQVHAGQILATLDSASAQAALTTAEDNLTAAQDNLATAQAGGETPPEKAQDAFSLESAETSESSAARHTRQRPADLRHGSGHQPGRRQRGAERSGRDRAGLPVGDNHRRGFLGASHDRLLNERTPNHPTGNDGPDRAHDDPHDNGVIARLLTDQWRPIRVGRGQRGPQLR